MTMPATASAMIAQSWRSKAKALEALPSCGMHNPSVVCWRRVSGAACVL